MAEKQAPIHREAFAVVSYDVQTRIRDEDDKSTIRSTPGVARFSRNMASQPPKPDQAAGEDSDTKNINRLDPD